MHVDYSVRFFTETSSQFVPKENLVKNDKNRVVMKRSRQQKRELNSLAALVMDGRSLSSL